MLAPNPTVLPAPFTIEFVVSHYDAAKGAVWGSRIEQAIIEVSAKSGEQLVLAQLDHKRAPGRSVIVRPRWNDGPGSFHEYRSLNGAPFRYVVMTFLKSDSPTPQKLNP